MQRVRWQSHEQDWLAKQVAVSLLRDGFTVEEIIEHSPRTWLNHLREAVARMTDDRQRKVITTNQVPWLYEKTIEWVESGKLQIEEDHHIEEIHEEFLEQKVDRLIKIQKRNRRLIRSLREQVGCLEELLLEMLSKLEGITSIVDVQQKSTEMNPPVPILDTPILENKPKVAVVGLRRHQFEILRQSIGQRVDLELYDYRKPPSSTHADKVVAMRTTPANWIRDAKRQLGDKFVKVRGTTELIKAVEEIL